MDETVQWEYRVEIYGSALRGSKSEEIEAYLNEWGEEGWEVISVQQHYGSSKMTIVAKRPLTTSARRRRSMPRYS